MKITITYGHRNLAFRGSLELSTARQDPRGLTGSEYGFLRIAEELAAAGHDVTAYTLTTETEPHRGIQLRHLDATIEPCDVMITLNEPDILRRAPAGAFRVALYWVNDLTGVAAGIAGHVDLWVSCSAPHFEQFRTNPAWHRVEVTPDNPNGAETYVPDPSKWCVVPLGCDPENFFGDGGITNDTIPPVFHPAKVSGKVVYCSSPDRGLHWLLQEWPAIKAAVPHATLSIFYRLEPWLRGWDNTPHFPPIEPLRSRALYIEECLRRFKAAGGMGVTVRDSVSRDVIEREMASAECLAYPCNTTTWSEGFSCTILECCAARACPVITDCDALGEVYASIDPVPMRDHIIGRHGEELALPWQEVWRERVIRALTDSEWRNEQNEKARALAENLTWKKTAAALVAQIERVRNVRTD